MSKWFANRPLWMLIVGLSVGLLVGAGMLTGALVTITHQNPETVQMPEVVLNATASHSGDTFAMATGPIDSDIEGLFTLDYLTGELQCFVLYPRMGKIGGVFKHNVIGDLGVQDGKNPNYVMVTGQAAFTRGGAAQSPAACVVYVADANSGNFAAYTIFWDRTRFRANAPQQGIFQLLDAGKARNVEIRQ